MGRLARGSVLTHALPTLGRHLLALLPELSSSLARAEPLFSAGRLPVVEGDDLGLDETALEVRVDASRGLWRGPAVVEGPASYLGRGVFVRVCVGGVWARCGRARV